MIESRSMSSVFALMGFSGFIAVAHGACGGMTVGTTVADGGLSSGVDGGTVDGAPCIGDPAPPVAAPVDKVDLLLMIDNSASMGEKQEYLRSAVPDLVSRLVQPNCVDTNDPNKVLGRSHGDGVCDQGKPEFLPVHDLHIGIVSSSLGTRGGDVCNPADKTITGLNAHNDDQAHLLNRAGNDEHAIADMKPSNFLSWFPSVPANAGKSPSGGAVAITDASALATEFEDLVVGVHQRGCGIESQLESWYRFLVQPDPYDHIETGGGTGGAKWVGVDATLLKQRHDFLRPDSVVAIVALSDENDSEIDVRSLGGQGYLWMQSGFQPPRATSACAVNPSDKACTSCKLAPNGGAGDPECAKGAYNAQNDWGFNMNLRHAKMKAKYGIELQFPMSRYVAGLTSRMVPDRNGEYPPGRANYVGDARCTNPLFAKALPDGTTTDAGSLCALAQGPRTPDMVFYLHIGGVPSALLHYAPGDAAKSALDDSDWTRIVGADPESYNFTGIDPHMIESFSPRAGLAPPSSADTADPIHGREWVTNVGQGVDLEYACTFALMAPRDCTTPANQETCDCPATAGFPHDQLPPLCDSQSSTTQVRAKAYPTPRETLLARKLGNQGVLGSICPVHPVEQGAGDPLYGFRPAFAALLDRMGPALGALRKPPTPSCP
jgi:hypothetical protein